MPRVGEHVKNSERPSRYAFDIHVLLQCLKSTRLSTEPSATTGCASHTSGQASIGLSTRRLRLLNNHSRNVLTRFKQKWAEPQNSLEFVATLNFLSIDGLQDTLCYKPWRMACRSTPSFGGEPMEQHLRHMGHLNASRVGNLCAVLHRTRVGTDIQKITKARLLCGLCLGGLCWLLHE